jgi:hypothetical protein
MLDNPFKQIRKFIAMLTIRSALHVKVVIHSLCGFLRVGQDKARVAPLGNHSAFITKRRGAFQLAAA